MFRKISWLAILSSFVWMTMIPGAASAKTPFITVASTTSTVNSGLMDFLLPMFKKKTGIDVRMIAVGTGQAVRTARNGDADVLFVHHRPSEDAFVAEGFGLKRYDVMFNDFIIVGPKTDPAGIRNEGNAANALLKIAMKKAPFVSRGDDSGTNKKERSIWKSANVMPEKDSGGWYREAGAGMGATLNTAAAMQAYTLSDRGTWIAFKNKVDLELLASGDPELKNPYGIILVNPKRFPHVKAKLGQAFIDWIVSAEGQTAIAAYRKNAEQLFFPNAR